MCLAFLILWIGSGFCRLAGDWRGIWATASGGRIGVTFWDHREMGELDLMRDPIDLVPGRWPSKRFELWFYADHNASYWHVDIPLWVPVLLMLVPTAIAWRRDGATRRKLTGVCEKCGYDRTGIALGGTCPECGALRPHT